MAYFSRQFSTASPVLTVPPQSPHQGPFGMAGFPRSPTPSSAPFGGFSTSPNSLAPFQPSTSTSRKRSRDEAASNLEPDIGPPQPKESEEVWEYGPGMTLIKSTKTYVAEAGSQSGTWVEEKKASQEDARRQSESDRKLLAPRSSKLQRVFGSNNHGSSLSTAGPGSVTSNVSKVTAANDKTPVIDNFTMHLGIGWRQLSRDEHIQAAARGWARYIENHYPISNAHIRLESRGLQSFLVESVEGFFLFSEDLRQGQLVSTSVDGALKNLQTSPPTFDGCITLHAAESPSATPIESRPLPAAMDAEMLVD